MIYGSVCPGGRCVQCWRAFSPKLPEFAAILGSVDQNRRNPIQLQALTSFSRRSSGTHPKIFTDTASGTKAERKGLEEALNYVREGDTLVVWRLDRLGRSLKHLIETISQLDTRKIGFKSLTENIDTTTSGGKLIFHIFGALAEFERNLIRERTNAGLQAARARGRKGGRPKALTPKKAQMVQDLYRNKDNSIDEICKILNISRTTLYRYIKT